VHGVIYDCGLEWQALGIESSDHCGCDSKSLEMNWKADRQ